MGEQVLLLYTLPELSWHIGKLSDGNRILGTLDRDSRNFKQRNSSRDGPTP